MFLAVMETSGSEEAGQRNNFKVVPFQKIEPIESSEEESEEFNESENESERPATPEPEMYLQVMVDENKVRAK